MKIAVWSPPARHWFCSARSRSLRRDAGPRSSTTSRSGTPTRRRRWSRCRTCCRWGACARTATTRRCWPRCCGASVHRRELRWGRHDEHDRAAEHDPRDGRAAVQRADAGHGPGHARDRRQRLRGVRRHHRHLSGLRASDPTGAPCKAHFTVNGVDTLKARIAQTQTRIAIVVQGIKERSPQATIAADRLPEDRAGARHLPGDPAVRRRRLRLPVLDRAGAELGDRPRPPLRAERRTSTRSGRRPGTTPARRTVRRGSRARTSTCSGR